MVQVKVGVKQNRGAHQMTQSSQNFARHAHHWWELQLKSYSQKKKKKVAFWHPPCGVSSCYSCVKIKAFPVGFSLFILVPPFHSSSGRNHCHLNQMVKFLECGIDTVLQACQNLLEHNTPQTSPLSTDQTKIWNSGIKNLVLVVEFGAGFWRGGEVVYFLGLELISNAGATI